MKVSNLLTAFTLLFTAASTCIAQTVPALVNYQGRLANPDGTPLATGDYTLTFRVYDSATNSSGLVWGPQVFDGVAGQGHGGKIPVVQGYFNVMLGPVDTNGVSLDTAFNATNRYVEIRVGTNNPILPRQQILSGPYAFQAGNSAKLAGADWSAVFGTNDPVNGKIPTSKLATNGMIVAQQIGVGTSSPATLLHVDGGTNDAWLRLETSSPVKSPTVQFWNMYGGSNWAGIGLNTTGVGGGLLTGAKPFALVVESGGTNAIQFGVNNSLAMSLVNGGNVGIGKDNPATALDVNGTVTATSFSGSGAGLAGITLTNLAARQVGTNVGIGGVAVSLPIVFQHVQGNSFQDIPNLTVTLQTTGRPVMAMVVPSLLNNFSNTPSTTAQSGLVYVPSNANNYLCLRLVRDDGAGAIATFVGTGLSSPTSVGYGSVIGTFVDLPTAGTHSFKLQAGTMGSGNPYADLYNSVLVVFEL